MSTAEAHGFNPLVGGVLMAPMTIGYACFLTTRRRRGGVLAAASA